MSCSCCGRRLKRGGRASRAWYVGQEDWLRGAYALSGTEAANFFAEEVRWPHSPSISTCFPASAPCVKCEAAAGEAVVSCEGQLLSMDISKSRN